jgi:excisionase family DNA binding protein
VISEPLQRSNTDARRATFPGQRSSYPQGDAANETPVHPARPIGAAHQVAPATRTLAEAARYLGLSPWTVRELIWRGVLHRVRLSRKILLDQRDLDTLIEMYKKDDIDGGPPAAVAWRPPMSLPQKARKGGKA